MRWTLLIVVLALSNGRWLTAEADAQATQPVSGAIPRPNAPLPAGMTPIFDGTSLDGWVQVPPNSWTVNDGILASIGTGRGVLYTEKQYTRYRIIFDIRHAGSLPKADHQACALFFGTMPEKGEKPLDALGAVQIQVPPGYTWDYRKGHNNDGRGEFKSFKHPHFDPKQWSRVEMLIDATRGTARMAVAQPPGSEAVEVVDFDVPDAGKTGPFALQMHNKGLFDEYANITIEENPATDELATTKANP